MGTSLEYTETPKVAAKSNPAKAVNHVSIADADTSYGPQAQRVITVTSNEFCGAEQMSSALVVMPPLKRARVHIHYKHESVLFFTEGWIAALIGPELEPIFCGPGDVLFIPENVIHVGINLSATQNGVLLETRSEPDFHEDINLLPHLEKKLDEVATDLQRKFAAGELSLPANWMERAAAPYQFRETRSLPPMSARPSLAHKVPLQQS